MYVSMRTISPLDGVSCLVQLSVVSQTESNLDQENDPKACIHNLTRQMACVELVSNPSLWFIHFLLGNAYVWCWKTLLLGERGQNYSHKVWVSLSKSSFIGFTKQPDGISEKYRYSKTSANMIKIILCVSYNINIVKVGFKVWETTILGLFS